jgi:glycogen phosphorylase
VPVFLGEISPTCVRVELFAEAQAGMLAEVIILHQGPPIPGTLNGYIYAGGVATSRAMTDYTVRVVPYHESVLIPTELPLVKWHH